MRVGVIGCGAIGSVIVEAVCRGEVKAELVALVDRYPEKCGELLKKCSKQGVAICKDMECLVNARPRLVIEAASQQAVRDYVPQLLAKGVDVVVLSVDTLLDEELYKTVLEASKGSGARVYIPTGAIAGVDAVKALASSVLRELC